MMTSDAEDFCLAAKVPKDLGHSTRTRRCGLAGWCHTLGLLGTLPLVPHSRMRMALRVEKISLRKVKSGPCMQRMAATAHSRHQETENAAGLILAFKETDRKISEMWGRQRPCLKKKEM
mmetsp:Transcript_22444/g.31412  ORF Transcript_22444/g.31412 Transcript_22444/m.31412 type:complete len:119 (-) Transcript_22444:162-518(-)